jgi:Zn-dependent protease
MLFSGLDAATLIARAIVLLIAFTLHELAHAVTADYLGDPTPRKMGRISLNPLVHLDPVGTIMLLISGFGWAKPVIVNPFNMRGNPHTDMAIVAAAGPLTNLALAAFGAIPFRLGWVVPAFNATASGDFLLTQFVWINLVLAFFNLIPVPPLDGYKILIGLLPFEIGIKLRPLERYGFLILMALIFFLPMIGVDILGTIVWQPAARVFQLLVGL